MNTFETNEYEGGFGFVASKVSEIFGHFWLNVLWNRLWFVDCGLWLGTPGGRAGVRVRNPLPWNLATSFEPSGAGALTGLNWVSPRRLAGVFVRAICGVAARWCRRGRGVI